MLTLHRQSNFGRRVQANGGVAMASILLLSLVIVSIGLSLLSFSQRDLRFQQILEAQDRARILSRAAVDHYVWLKVSNLLPPEPADFSFELELSPTDRVTVVTTGTATPGRKRDVICSGFVLDTLGEQAARAQIVVPRGNEGGSYAL